MRAKALKTGTAIALAYGLAQGRRNLLRKLLMMLILVTPWVTQAAALPERQRIFVETSLSERPSVYVFLDQPLITFFASKYAFEWTIDGEPGPPTLNGVAECNFSRTTPYACSALQNGFTTGQALQPKCVKDPEQQAFILRDMDFDTEYCFRFRVEQSPGQTPWTP